MDKQRHDYLLLKSVHHAEKSEHYRQARERLQNGKSHARSDKFYWKEYSRLSMGMYYHARKSIELKRQWEETHG